MEPRLKVIWTKAADDLIVALRMQGVTTPIIVEALNKVGIPANKNMALGRVFRLRKAGVLPDALPSLGVYAKPGPKPKAPGSEIRAQYQATPKRMRPLHIPKPIKPKSPAEKPAKAQPAPELVKPAPPPPKPPAPAPEPPAAPAKPERIYAPLGLWDAWPSNACRYPIYGKTREPDAPLFCGAKVSQPPYCTEHRALVYQPRPEPAIKKAPSKERPTFYEQDRE